jgi:hypothetical protein
VRSEARVKGSLLVKKKRRGGSESGNDRLESRWGGRMRK